MSEMVDRVAKAICKSRYLNGGVEEDDGWDSCPKGLKAEYLQAARAAIDAMREPTREMSHVGNCCGVDASPNEIWQTMIAAALK